MKKTVYILLALSVLSACQSKQETLKNKIITLSESDTSGSQEAMRQLAGMWEEYGTQYPEDSVSATWLNNALNQYYHMGAGDKVVRISHFMFKNFDSTKNLQAYSSLGSHYAKNVKTSDSAIYYLEILQDRVGLDMRTQQDLANSYINYAKNHAQDEKAPEYMFKAGIKLVGLNHTGEGESALKVVAVEYPGSKYHPPALQMLGYIYENNYNDTATARKYYQTLVREHPTHPLAESTPLVLNKYLGKSADEIYEDIKKNQPAQ